MKSNVILGGTLLVLLGSSVVWAGDPWKEKPYTEWTQEEIVKILLDSPWAKKLRTETGTTKAVSKSVNAGRMEKQPIYDDKGRVVDYRPGVVDYRPGYRPQFEEITVQEKVYTEVFIQWASSLTIRQVQVRQGLLRGTMTKEKVNQLLAVRPSQYVIVVQSLYLPRMLARYENLFKRLSESAYLRLKRSKQNISPVRLEVQGAPPTVLKFYFPRRSEGKPVIGLDENEVEFRWILPKKGKTKAVKIKTAFDLRKMVRDGKPDL